MITIKINGVEISVETENEFDIVMRHSAGIPAPVAPEPIAEKPVETEPIKESENNVVQFNSAPLTTVNTQSRYYNVPAGTRRFKSVARIYDYIEMHKRGRTTVQIAEHFKITKASANSTLNTLKNEGLIVQPNGRGTAWIATNTDIVLLGMEDSHANES